MSTEQSDLHHLCVVSSVFLIKFKKNLVLTFKQFRSNTKLHYLRFMRDKQGNKKKKKKKHYLGSLQTVPTVQKYSSSSKAGDKRYDKVPLTSCTITKTC